MLDLYLSERVKKLTEGQQTPTTTKPETIQEFPICPDEISGVDMGNVEKSSQRRSRHFAVLTYRVYAPRVKRAAALLSGLF